MGLQLEPNDKGLGVLGVVEADFLTPTHNKQDFDDTPTYRLPPYCFFTAALTALLVLSPYDYWHVKAVLQPLCLSSLAIIVWCNAEASNSSFADFALGCHSQAGVVW